MKVKGFKKETRLLLFTNSLVLISAAMVAPIYALYVKDIGGNLMDASIALGLFALAAGIVTLLSGKFVDKAKNKVLIIVLGYSLIGIGFFLYTIVNSVIFLFLVQILIGIGEAIYSPAFDALYGDSLKKKYRGLGWGMWEFTNYLTIALGAFGGGLMVTYLGFNSIFISMGVLCFFSAGYLYIFSKKNNKK